jgi:hypothetical protein
MVDPTKQRRPAAHARALPALARRRPAARATGGVGVPAVQQKALAAPSDSPGRSRGTHRGRGGAHRRRAHRRPPTASPSGTHRRLQLRDDLVCPRPSLGRRAIPSLLRGQRRASPSPASHLKNGTPASRRGACGGLPGSSLQSLPFWRRDRPGAPWLELNRRHNELCCHRVTFAH